MQVLNQSRGKILAERVTVAARRWARLCGLIGRKSLPRGRALLLPYAKGIHTIGMKFAIDVLFVDESGTVIHLIHHMKPFRFSPLFWNSAGILELPAGVIDQTETDLGDCIGYM